MGFRDMDLDDQVRASLRRDPDLSHYRIDVKVQNGIVYLMGNVNSTARDQAVALARGVDTVAVVVDHLTVTA